MGIRSAARCLRGSSRTPYNGTSGRSPPGLPGAIVLGKREATKTNQLRTIIDQQARKAGCAVSRASGFLMIQRCGRLDLRDHGDRAGHPSMRTAGVGIDTRLVEGLAEAFAV